MTNHQHLANFVKYNRIKQRLTQEELAQKAGVGLRFLRELEQGKETLRIDKVNQVLQLFGYSVSAKPSRVLDPYEILLNNFNKNVHVYLKDKTVLVGFIVDAVYEGGEIKGWKFVSNNKAIEYQKSENPELIQLIDHQEIEAIENL